MGCADTSGCAQRAWRAPVWVRSSPFHVVTWQGVGSKLGRPLQLLYETSLQSKPSSSLLLVLKPLYKDSSQSLPVPFLLLPSSIASPCPCHALFPICKSTSSSSLSLPPLRFPVESMEAGCQLLKQPVTRTTVHPMASGAHSLMSTLNPKLM